MSFDWEFFLERLFSPGENYLWALVRTIVIAVLAQLLGVVIGFILGFGRLSRFRLVRAACGFYVWVIRGIPALVLLVLLFSGLAAAGFYRFEDIRLGSLVVPATVQAAIIGLGLHSGAYMAEIVRNGIQAVARGQIEAGKALGMSTWQIGRRIIVPQATRVIVPPLGNEFNGMIKTTSLAMVIGVQEIFLVSQTAAAATFRVFELLIVVSITYLVVISVWNAIQGVIETKLRAYEADVPARTWWQAVKFYVRKPSTGMIRSRA
jgi:polar amino acid transport system permease protein